MSRTWQCSATRFSWQEVVYTANHWRGSWNAALGFRSSLKRLAMLIDPTRFPRQNFAAANTNLSLVGLFTIEGGYCAFSPSTALNSPRFCTRLRHRRLGRLYNPMRKHTVHSTGWEIVTVPPPPGSNQVQSFNCTNRIFSKPNTN